MKYILHGKWNMCKFCLLLEWCTKWDNENWEPEDFCFPTMLMTKIPLQSAFEIALLAYFFFSLFSPVVSLKINSTFTMEIYIHDIEIQQVTFLMYCNVSHDILISNDLHHCFDYNHFIIFLSCCTSVRWLCNNLLEKKREMKHCVAFRKSIWKWDSLCPCLRLRVQLNFYTAWQLSTSSPAISWFMLWSQSNILTQPSDRTGHLMGGDDQIEK